MPQQECPSYISDVSQCHEREASRAEVVRFPMMHLWSLSISRLCIGAVHLASYRCCHRSASAPSVLL